MLCVNSLWHGAVTVSNENKIIETYSSLSALPLSKRTEAAAHSFLLAQSILFSSELQMPPSFSPSSAQGEWETTV